MVFFWSDRWSGQVGGHAQQSTAQAQRKLASAWHPQAGKHDTARIKLLIAARIMHGDMLEYCQKVTTSKGTILPSRSRAIVPIGLISPPVRHPVSCLGQLLCCRSLYMLRWQYGNRIPSLQKKKEKKKIETSTITGNLYLRAAM